MDQFKQPKPESRHRSASRRGLGGVALGWFYEARHAAAEPVTSNRPELLKRPKFELEYRVSGLFDTNLVDEAVSIEQRQPLLTAHEVAEQTDMPSLGKLVAVISLPSKQTTIREEQRDKQIELLCFSQRVDGRPQHTIMSRLQLSQARDRFHQSGEAILPEGTIVLHPGDAHQIGRGMWLPDVGYEVDALDRDPTLATHYGSVSRVQAEVIVDNLGNLIIDDKDSLYGTGVTLGPLIPAALHEETTGQFAAVG